MAAECGMTLDTTLIQRRSHWHLGTDSLPKLKGDNCCSLLGQPPAQVLPAPRIACREDLVEGADAALLQLSLERRPLPQAAGFCTATTASMFMQDWEISGDSLQWYLVVSCRLEVSFVSVGFMQLR